MKLYHNPRCSKSRQALSFLKENEINFDIVLYMKDSLSSREIKGLLRKLKMAPIDLIRKNEPVWKDKFLGKEMNEEDLVNAMILHPKLMGRPLVESQNAALLAVITENIKDLL